MHKIKRYVNRKLYDTTDKKYVTMDQISALIKEGEEVTIIDNKTGADITASTVSQLLARDKKSKNNEMSSGVLIQLLRKGPETVVDYGKKYVSLWQRALTTAEGEMDKLVKVLIKNKELTESEAGRLKNEIVGHADDFKKWIGEKIDQRVKEALRMVNLSSKDQVLELTSQVKALTKKVEQLEKQQLKKSNQKSSDE